MMKLVGGVLESLIAAFYQPFWYAVLTSVLIMYFYIIATKKVDTGNGWKAACLLFVEFWKSDKGFRKKYILVFYSVLVIFKTLINRDLWLNPLSKIMDDLYWFEFNTNTGVIEFNPEPIENILMFIPLIILIYYNFYDVITKGKKGAYFAILKGSQFSFGISLSIEVLQLFLHLGTFQVADLLYNTIGGCVGSVFYCLVMMLKRRFKRYD